MGVIISQTKTKVVQQVWSGQNQLDEKSLTKLSPILTQISVTLV